MEGGIVCVYVYGGTLVKKVFVSAIDWRFVRSNVSGLTQTNIDVEAVKRLSWGFW